MRADPRTGAERRVETGGAADGELPERGELFVLSAPSGVGKTTLIRRMFERYPNLAATVTFSVSHTTRPPRAGEVDGRDYHFVDGDEFEEMVAGDRFLEWAVVHGRRYGTSTARKPK